MLPVSLCDWPGRVTSVLFVGGCNLRCPTCHNAALAWNWTSLPALEHIAILKDLHRRKRWLDGITVSGGEPTTWPNLPALLADLAAVGLPLKLDSNGSAPAMLNSLLRSGLVQTLAVDVKGPWDLYPELTGGCMTPTQAQHNLEQIFELAREFPGRVYFRCTKVPGLSEADLRQVGALVPGPVLFQDFVPPKAV